MKKYLEHNFGKFRSPPRVTQYAWMIFVTLLLVWIAINVTARAPVAEKIVHDEQNKKIVSLPTQIVGSETEAFATVSSWPGEIISPNDIDVHPPRVGTIISWDVTIGEYVNAGQVLGRLSATALTPELAKTLADQTEALTRARANASSTRAFTTQTQGQLGTFSNADTAKLAIAQAESIASASGERMRTVLRQAVAKEFPEFTLNGEDALSLHSKNRLYTAVLKRNFGVRNVALPEQYLSSVSTLLKSLDNNALSEQEGKDYFAISLRLVGASIADDGYSQSQLDELKKVIIGDQSAFNEAIEKYRAALLEISTKQKELAERSRDASNRITELDRERVNAQNDLTASEAAYRVVTQALTGGTIITAPKSGYISTLIKQVGEFTTPMDAVASISSRSQTDKIVRFRIPSSTEVPKRGEQIRVVRPGFAKDVQSATIIGIGTALDGNGSFMADARFEKSVAWPAHLSVRVIPAKRSSQTITVPFDAVFWDEENHPHVWLVNKEGVVASRAVRTGRTFGDAVEILEGLTLGDTYVSIVSDNIKAGMQINETVTAEESTTPKGEGDGHSHNE